MVRARLQNWSQQEPLPRPTCTAAGVDDPRPIIRCGGDDGGQRVRAVVVDDPQHRAGVDFDAADGDDVVCVPLHSLPQSVLRRDEGEDMNATDVMVRNVVTVHPETDMAEAVKLLAEHDVSALRVLDGMGNLVGMLSEADLIHRVEIGTEKHRPWWQEAVTGASTLAADFAKSHGKKVGEIMTTGVV